MQNTFYHSGNNHNVLWYKAKLNAIKLILLQMKFKVTGFKFKRYVHVIIY